jgi:DNA-binding response OmpR family regulator
MTKKKILLVDDANTVLMMEKMMLKDAYEIVTARDGEEGVKKAIEERPDLILLDVMMPNMDGFEACRQIRAHVDTKATPIIMVTTRSEAVNMKTGFDCGANEYMTKPFNGPELLAKLKSYLHQ